ncbi:hypothetical protein [Sphingomonas pituitosa]|uniref:hypothetical protein n=1 Tax=Sphingomonas pituitosa TaxID=99597 RepID=UPI000A07336D|nr:hypothetical protein [Sphingomonas pituitosa]
MSDPRWWERRWFALAAVLLSAVPLLWPAIPPLTDLPGHIGRFRVMLDGNAGPLAAWYRFRWMLVGNLGVDLAVRALAPWVGLLPAVKLAVIATVMLMTAGILWIAQEVHGRIQPWTIAALPLVHSYAFHFGFVNYLLAMALALNAFALWLRLGRQRRFRLRAAVFVPLSLAIWLAHVVGWAMLGLFVFAAELRDWRKLPIRLLPLAPPAALLLLWRSGSSAGLSGPFFVWNIKLAWLLSVLRDRWQPLDLLSVALLFGLLYQGWRDPATRVEPRLQRAFLLVLAAFLLLPFMLFHSAYADMRLVPFLLLLALLALEAKPSLGARRKAVIAGIALAFLLVRTGATTASLALYDHDWRQRLAALDHLPQGARLVSFVGETCGQPWRHRRLNHLPGLALAERRAFSNDQWPLAGGSPLTIHAPAAMAGFDSDPAQMVLARPCPVEPGFRTLEESLAALPRDAFDYVWLIHPPAIAPRGTAGMTRIWSNGEDALYRIDHKRLSPGASPH